MPKLTNSQLFILESQLRNRLEYSKFSLPISNKILENQKELLNNKLIGGQISGKQYDLELENLKKNTIDNETLLMISEYLANIID